MEKDKPVTLESGTQQASENKKKESSNSNTSDCGKKPAQPKEDYRDLIKHCHLSDGHQKATGEIKGLGIICSINKVVSKEPKDRVVIGCYNHIAVWDRKSKDLQLHKKDLGGIWAYREYDGYEVIVPDGTDAVIMRDGEVIWNLGHSLKVTYVKGRMFRFMCRSQYVQKCAVYG